MRNLLGRFKYSCWCVGLLIAGTTVQAEQGAVYSMKAVKKNPLCTAGLVGQVCGGDRQCDTAPLTFNGQCGGDITPTNTIEASPGDIIVAEIFGSNWSPTGQRLQAFQFTIDEEGYSSGGGKILPYGWDAPPEDVPCEAEEDCPAGMSCDTDVNECKAITCTSDPDCPPEYPVCQVVQTCAGANHEPESGAFADDFRLDELDWVFQGCSTLGAVDMSTLSYRYGWVISGSLLCAPTYTEPKYFGTVMLVIPLDACGVYTIPLLGSPESVMADTNGLFIEPIKTESLTIKMEGGACECRITDSTPSNCALDGRQPSEPDGTSEAGWSEIKFDLDEDCSSCDISGRFSVVQLPPDFGNPISVSNAACTDAKTVTVTLSRPILTNTWTCVTYLLSNQEVCVGYLPGDSDENSINENADILHLIDCLNGDETCQIHQCDMDRSGSCGPADLLRAIDLRNGAETYEVWLGQEIERFGNTLLCPTGP